MKGSELLIIIGSLVGLLIYTTSLRRSNDKKDFEIEKLKNEGEVKVNEYKVQEASKRAASSLSEYRKLRGTKKP